MLFTTICLENFIGRNRCWYCDVIVLISECPIAVLSSLMAADVTGCTALCILH